MSVIGLPAWMSSRGWCLSERSFFFGGGTFSFAEEKISSRVGVARMGSSAAFLSSLSASVKCFTALSRSLKPAPYTTPRFRWVRAMELSAVRSYFSASAMAFSSSSLALSNSSTSYCSMAWELSSRMRSWAALATCAEAAPGQSSARPAMTMNR